jgi:hypothetical protein
MKHFWALTGLLGALHAQAAEPLTPASLKVEGLTYRREIDRIYWGDFEHVHLDHNGLEFGLMVGAYMKDFGAACPAALPKNKVEIMAQRCTDESYWVNGYGAEVPGSRTCTHYETYGTHVFADPDLYNASQFEDGKMATAMLGQMGQSISKTGNAGINAAMGNFMQSRDVAKQVSEFQSDLKQLLQNNVCGGESLKRFEQNLIAYAGNKPPIRMAGIPTFPGLTRDSDYQTLLDDIVSEQASGWMFNRFVKESIANVTVDKRDAAGHALSVSANYAFQSTKGRVEGKVQLRFFDDGSPRCLVFSDMPDACRPVDHGLIAAFEDGKYATGHAAAARTYVAPDLRQVLVRAAPNQTVLVEIPGRSLDMPQGINVPITGRLLRDITGTGPEGGSIILAAAGSVVYMAILNSQRSTQFHLNHVGDDPSRAILFYKTSKEYRAGVDPLPHDGSPVKLSFDLEPNIERKMLLNDYEKQRTAVTTNTSPQAAGELVAVGTVSGGSGTAPRRSEPPSAVQAMGTGAEPSGTPAIAKATARATTPAVQLQDLAGSYSGTYVCGSQKTPLKLTVSVDTHSTLQAVFAATIQGLPAYDLRGSFSSDQNQFYLNAVRWEGRPLPGYRMVGMRGNFDPNGPSLRGKITDPLCGEFYLEREQ